MDTKYFHNVHIGLKIKDLVKKRRMSVEKDLATKLQKTKAGIYKDFEKDDLYLKQVVEYLRIVEVDTCDFMKDIGLCEEKDPFTLHEPNGTYQVNSELLKKENEMLSKIIEEKERLLEEKERLISVLMGKTAV